MAIPTAIRLQISQRANFLCEYCHSSEEVSPARFEIDHIQPRSIGDSDNIDNLALACQRCNSHHYNFIQGKDPATLNAVNLFHPRHQVWNDHFIWSNDGCRIIGITETGSATVNRLDLNDVTYFCIICYLLNLKLLHLVATSCLSWKIALALTRGLSPLPV